MAKLTEAKFKKLHENIDSKLQIDIAALKAKAEHEHNALNTVWNMLQDAPLPNISSNNGANNDDRKAYPTRKWILQIINSLPGDAEISQPQIFDALTSAHPEIGQRGDRSVKGQIAAVLKKFAEQRVLLVKTPAHGQDPTIYTKHIQIDVISD